MANLQVEPRERIIFLESVRGIAALIVVFEHLISALFPAAAITTLYAQSHSRFLERLLYGMPFGFLIGGHFAVMTFFVLSGFVLSIGYFQSKQVATVISQALKRYLRLGIPVLASVLIGFVFLKLNFLHYQTAAAAKAGYQFSSSAWSAQPNIWDALRSGVFGVLLQGKVGYNPVLWTMYFELVGSFIVFGTLLLFANLRKRWLIYLVLSIIFWNSYFLTFVAGVALADLYVNRRSAFISGNSFRVLSFLAIAVIGSIPTAFLGHLPTTLTKIAIPHTNLVDSMMLWQSLGAILLLYVVLGWPGLHRVLEHKLLSWLGKISFGLYLTHYIVIASFSTLLFSKLHTSDYRLDSFIVLVASLPLTLVIAAIWTKYIDAFAIAKSRSFARLFINDLGWPSYGLELKESIVSSPQQRRSYERGRSLAQGHRQTLKAAGRSLGIL